MKKQIKRRSSTCSGCGLKWEQHANMETMCKALQSAMEKINALESVDGPCSWIVELEPGVWLFAGEGDPSRTLVRNTAIRFPRHPDAMIALENARKHRPFRNAVIRKI